MVTKLGMAQLILVCCCFLIPTMTRTVFAASTTRPSSPTPSLAPAQSAITSTMRPPPARSSRSTTKSLNMTSPSMSLTTNSTMANTTLLSTSPRSPTPRLTTTMSQTVSNSSTVTTQRLKTRLSTVSDINATTTSYQNPSSGMSTTVRIVIGVVIALVVLVTVLVGGWWVCRRNAASRDSNQNQPSIELTPQGTYKPSRDSLAREVTPNYLHLIHDAQSPKSPKSPTEKTLYQSSRRLYLYDDIDISDTRKSEAFKNMVASEKNGNVQVEAASSPGVENDSTARSNAS